MGHRFDNIYLLTVNSIVISFLSKWKWRQVAVVVLSDPQYSEIKHYPRAGLYEWDLSNFIFVLGAIF